MRLYYKPLVLLIWLGAVVMMLGGALSLSDRRLRIGAPKPARRRSPPCSRRSRDRCAASRSLRSCSRCWRRGAAFAVQPDEMLKDPALEARARHLSQELRCMVCQNQSIDDSEAPLARDLRVLVRERLEAGDSDQQVLDFLVARYGEFVLLKPPFKLDTLLLWGLPPLALLAGLVGIAADGAPPRTSVAQAPQPLTPQEQEKVATLVEPGSERSLNFTAEFQVRVSSIFPILPKFNPPDRTP